MSITLERVLDSTALSPDGIEAMRDREEARAYIPLLDARLTIYDEALVRGRNEQPIPRIVDTRTEDLYLEFMVLATWPFYEFRILSTESDAVRSPLYELRRQIAFAAEDAWHERMMNLERLERGLSDAEQIAVLKARIEALDAVLDVWGWRNIQRSSK